MTRNEHFQVEPKVFGLVFDPPNQWSPSQMDLQPLDLDVQGPKKLRLGAKFSHLDVGRAVRDSGGVALQEHVEVQPLKFSSLVSS